VTPFDRDFVDEFKSTIPPGERKWDAVEKVWIVSYVYLPNVIGMLNKYFDEVSNDIIEDQKLSLLPDPYAVMFLLPEAPSELVKFAYRLLSIEWRSVVKIEVLNQAYEQIKKEREIS
jgi:hypothetical protein